MARRAADLGLNNCIGPLASRRISLETPMKLRLSGQGFSFSATASRVLARKDLASFDDLIVVSSNKPAMS